MGPAAASGRRGGKGLGARGAVGPGPRALPPVARGLRRGLLGIRPGSLRGAAAAAGLAERTGGRRLRLRAGARPGEGLPEAQRGLGSWACAGGHGAGRPRRGVSGLPVGAAPSLEGWWERLAVGISTGWRARQQQFLCCNRWQLARVTGILVANAR